MKIYISATADDLKKYRDELKNTLQRWDHDIYTEDDLAPAQRNRRTDRLKLIDEAPVFIGLYAYRYGHMPQGDSLSLLEHEYRYAVKQQKDIFCFFIDPELEWPAELREDDFIKQTRLSQLLEDIRESHFRINFRDAFQVSSHLRPELETLSKEYDRIKRLQEWSRSFNSDKKLDAIRRLSTNIRPDGLSEETFVKAAQLIANDFDPEVVQVTEELFQDTERLLKDEINSAAYIKNAGKFNRKGLLQLTREHLKTVIPVIAIAALALGLALGRAFFGGAVSSGTVASSSADGEILQKLMENKVVGQIRQDNFNQIEGREALSFLQFAYRIDPEAPAVRFALQSLEKDLRGIIHDESAGTKQLRDGQAFAKAVCEAIPLQSICDEVHFAQSRLDARGKFQQAASAWKKLLAEDSLGNTESAIMVTRFTQFSETYPAAAARYKVAEKIKQLQADVLAADQKRREEAEAEALRVSLAERAARQDSAAAPVEDEPPVAAGTSNDGAQPADSADEPPAAIDPAPYLTVEKPPMPENPDVALRRHLSSVNEDTVTVIQALANWKEFWKRTFEGSENRAYAEQEILRLEEIVAKTATIRTPDNFVTCQNVNRAERKPENISDEFPVGKIWLFTRIHAPRPEAITTKWYLNGRLFYAGKTEISNVSDGYRIYLAKSYKSGQEGFHEVRMYNAENVLIGRRQFRVNTTVARSDSLNAAQ